MTRYIGTVVRGVRAPFIREGDDIVKIVVDAVKKAAASENLAFHDRDVVSITESIVARAQGNYASIEQVAQDISAKFPQKELAVLFPILSRNRFGLNLQAMARAMEKIYLFLSYPADEVGNRLVPTEVLYNSKVNPYQDVLTETEFYQEFGHHVHPFTKVDYISYYKEIIEQEDCEAEIIFANNPCVALDFCEQILSCDVHSRKQTKKLLAKAGAPLVLNLEDILTTSVAGSGYNAEYGLLGANRASDDNLKLFPRDNQEIVEAIAKEFKEQTGKNIEVMVYGDGAFRDPVAGIWELADPVVSPAYTAGLEGVPQEIKLKYLADNDFAQLKGAALDQAIIKALEEKEEEPVASDSQLRQGTTPRRITDLLGSLSDLSSGSGDKGTPIVWIQGYFDNFSD